MSVPLFMFFREMVHFPSVLFENGNIQCSSIFSSRLISIKTFQVMFHFSSVLTKNGTVKSFSYLSLYTIFWFKFLLYQKVFHFSYNFLWIFPLSFIIHINLKKPGSYKVSEWFIFVPLITIEDMNRRNENHAFIVPLVVMSIIYVIQFFLSIMFHPHLLLNN